MPSKHNKIQPQYRRVGPAIPDIAEQAIYCEICNMWLPDNNQWEDHQIGKKHKKKLKKRRWIPKGTALILEQEAIAADAVMQYTLSVYRRAAIRANL